MNKDVELEYRVEIPFEEFEKQKSFLSKKARIINQAKRISLMVFVFKNDTKSILYVRATKNVENDELDCEIVHKKGAQHSHDRKETTIKVSKDDFKKFFRLFSNFSADKKIVMQRETVNFVTENDINIALVKARKHAYIEVEKMCTEQEKESVEKEVLNFVQDCVYKVLDEKGANELFERLDEIDDIKLTEEGEESQEIIDALEFL